MKKFLFLLMSIFLISLVSAVYTEDPFATAGSHSYDTFPNSPTWFTLPDNENHFSLNIPCHSESFSLASFNLYSTFFGGYNDWFSFKTGDDLSYSPAIYPDLCGSGYCYQNTIIPFNATNESLAVFSYYPLDRNYIIGTFTQGNYPNQGSAAPVNLDVYLYNDSGLNNLISNYSVVQTWMVQTLNGSYSAIETHFYLNATLIVGETYYIFINSSTDGGTFDSEYFGLLFGSDETSCLNNFSIKNSSGDFEVQNGCVDVFFYSDVSEIKNASLDLLSNGSYEWVQNNSRSDSSTTDFSSIIQNYLVEQYDLGVSSCLIDFNFTSSTSGALEYKNFQYSYDIPFVLGDGVIETIKLGGSIGDVLRSWNPEVYSLLGDAFKDLIDGSNLGDFFDNSWRVSVLFVQYLFRQPASLVANGGAV